MAVTLVLTLAIPLQQAVFLGVLLSILVHFFVTSSHEVRMTLLTLNADGTVTEGAAPAELPSNAVTVLEVFGDMAVAGAETLEAQLPAVKQAERPVVILRMRAQESIGSSFIAVVERYAQQLKAHGGKLMLAGVHPKDQGATGSHRDHRRDPGRGECLRGHNDRSAPARGRHLPPRSAGSRSRLLWRCTISVRQQFVHVNEFQIC